MKQKEALAEVRRVYEEARARKAGRAHEETMIGGVAVKCPSCGRVAESKGVLGNAFRWHCWCGRIFATNEREG